MLTLKTSSRHFLNYVYFITIAATYKHVPKYLYYKHGYPYFLEVIKGEVNLDIFKICAYKYLQTAHKISA